MNTQRDWQFESYIVEMSLEEFLKLNCEAYEIFDVDYDWLSNSVDDKLAFCEDEDAPVSGLMINNLMTENKIYLYASDAEYIVQDIIDYYRTKEHAGASNQSAPKVGFL
jgi:hypothetical protein